MIEEGKLLWTPSADFIANSQMAKFMEWLKQTKNLHFPGYAELHAWSVKDLDGFWRAIWDYFERFERRRFREGHRPPRHAGRQMVRWRTRQLR